MAQDFKFNISLSVLNHLGRNLYRNFITVIGEAISNSWDADAKNVWINIDKDNNCMSVIDDGVGMSADDFQNKFLKIGYSKRKDNNFKSRLGRPFIGRKGIGKLALLSCAKKIQVVTKTLNTNIVGGLIDNAGLDVAIKDDVASADYPLGRITDKAISIFGNRTNGTLIYFEKLNEEVYNTLDYLKKVIALSFRFTLIDSEFKIYLNNELVSIGSLKDLAESTQFVWTINDYTDEYLDSTKSIIKVRNITNKSSQLPLRGFIATTVKPKDLKIRGTEEKVALDLFVNGRVREKDILKHIPTARIVESYTYGQLFYDKLDEGNGTDVFTSSRESIVANDLTFRELLKEIKRIFAEIMDEWDPLRRRYGYDGDVDNPIITPKARKAQELYNRSVKDMNINANVLKNNELVESWVNELAEESTFNIPAYTECFISENLLRKYIEYNKLPLSKEAQDSAKDWKNKELNNKNKANISYDIRKCVKDIYYLNMDNLAYLVDNVKDTNQAGISKSSIIYKPIRDAVGHTSIITPIAKQQLNVEFENIKARLVELLKRSQPQN